MTGIPLALVAMGVLIVLGACGETTQDRTLTGAGIGATGTAILSAVTPVGPLGGALIGSAVGGASEALTAPSEFNVGKPVLREGLSRLQERTHPF